MPKNRDYTRLERTPSSMAWLIGQRAKLRDQLDRYRAQEEALPEKIRILEMNPPENQPSGAQLNVSCTCTAVLLWSQEY